VKGQTTVSIELIVFQLEEWRFALPLAVVQEIFHAVRVVPLPGAPAIVLGVVDVRGLVVRVLDVRQRFGLAHRPAQVDDHFVLAQAGARTVALCVDRALDLFSIDERELVLASRLAPGATLVKGVLHDADGLVVVQELDAFLSASEEVALGAALAGAAGAGGALAGGVPT
jgi:purine-binding chemotaxis protein CheW